MKNRMGNITKGILKTVIGDVTSPQITNENEVPVIPHCCNNLGVMGAGVALALKKKWSGVEVYYKKSVMELGTISSYVEFTGEFDPPKRTPTVCVFNMIGQDGTVSPNNPKPVKYWALAEAMRKIAVKLDAYSLSYPDNKFVIHAPKFG